MEYSYYHTIEFLKSSRVSFMAKKLFSNSKYLHFYKKFTSDLPPTDKMVIAVYRFPEAKTKVLIYLRAGWSLTASIRAAGVRGDELKTLLFFDAEVGVLDKMPISVTSTRGQV